MTTELIITEKPQAAKKIASALADTVPKKENVGGVPVYSLTRHGKRVIVGCAVGHLFTVAEKNKGKWTYPVFDVEWVPTHKVDKNAKFSEKYVAALKKSAKEADIFTVACDYDIEGEVIGYNIIKHICKQKDARRMKFSTLTTPDLVEAYEHVHPTIDWGQANAGVTRHELDWYYGINLSRALTKAVKAGGMFKILSSGRVQGPALKIIVEREKEIMAFVPEPYWQIELKGIVRDNPIIAWHSEDKFWDKPKADEVMARTKGKDGKISSVDASRFNQAPPVPFDLTTLQTEAYRSMRFAPKKTLEIAQELYIAGLISYPRTSSQVLDPKIGFTNILKELAQQEYYKELAERLLARPSLAPNNGKKTDPAHPAIYPTGQITDIDDDKARLYDLIVRRFLATFADPAVRETVTIKVGVDIDEFIAKGTRTVEKGWHDFYGNHVRMEEEELPLAQQGDSVKVESIDEHSKQTQPPKRYTPASIIRELEKRNLGTKATRAAIVDALYDRGYVNETSIQATTLGIKTCDTLEKYSPEILDEELTRHFEIEMEKISEQKMKPETVLSEAREKLTQVLARFKKKEKEIGTELAEALKTTRDDMSYIGECQACGKGKLEIRKGKFGQFIACNQYPDCKTTFKIPPGKIKASKKICEQCNHPMIEIFKKGKIPQTICLNPACPSKQSDSEQASQMREQAEENNGHTEKICPKCQKPLVFRKSIYGEFLGCSGYPKCRYTEKLEEKKAGEKTDGQQ